MHKLPTEELYKLRLEIGMMFQTSGLFTDPVYENIAFRSAKTSICPKTWCGAWC